MSILIDVLLILFKFALADLAVLVLGDGSKKVLLRGLVYTGLGLLFVKTRPIFVFVLSEGLNLSLMAEDGQVLNIHELSQQDGVRSRLLHLMSVVELNRLLVVYVVGIVNGPHFEVMGLTWYLIDSDLRSKRIGVGDLAIGHVHTFTALNIGLRTRLLFLPHKL